MIFTPPAIAVSHSSLSILLHARSIAVSADEHMVSNAILGPWKLKVYDTRFAMDAKKVPGPELYTWPLREPIVVKVIRLDHADAEQLASVLSPLLSKDGRMIAYPPTNTLIIKDRKSLVEQLVRVIKWVSAP